MNSRRPVREVLTNHGTSMAPSTATGGRALLVRLSLTGHPALLGVRNALRTRSRTVLTVLAVSLGGAAFMAAISTGTAWNRAVDSEFEARVYDLDVRLDTNYSIDALDEALAAVPEVDAVEAWAAYSAAMQIPDGGYSAAFPLLIPPADTTMIDFPLLEGRWLQPLDRNAIVITQNLDDPVPAVGTTVTISVDNTDTSWTVVGKVRQLSSGQTGLAYASNTPNGLDTGNVANRVRIIGHKSPSLLTAVENGLDDARIGVTGISTAVDGREALDDHLYIITGLLLLMALLLSVIGALGLAQTMSINVLERRREIGVMRATGATTGAVIRVVTTEGIFLGVLSWLAAIALSVPATATIETITGNIFLNAPLVTTYSPIGPAIWLAIVIAVAFVASALPALETTEIPASQALAYE
ncbi:MAG: ABC transporter permease [Actinomycetia bacterium]|nr:ABC transporter permease [Actinomycetes bacterium]